MIKRLLSTFGSTLYLFPSMNFGCNGTVTDIRMSMDFVDGIQYGQQQVVIVYIFVFQEGLDFSTRKVTHILLNQHNTEQVTFTEIWTNRAPLSLDVTEGSFIGLAVPGNRSLNIFTKSINLSPNSERVAHIYQLASNFSEFEEKVLEAARTANSSQFTSEMIAPPLIHFSFSK